MIISVPFWRVLLNSGENDGGPTAVTLSRISGSGAISQASRSLRHSMEVPAGLPGASEGGE